MSHADRGQQATGAGAAPTVASFKSEDSTEQLINGQKVKEVNELSVQCKSVEAGSEQPVRRKLVLVLGVSQVVLGALLVCAGAAGVVRGAALARVGGGLWAGAAAVVTGVLGALAGLNDCYGLYGVGSRSPLLTTFLALSLLCLACGQCAAVLAATGLQRDSLRQPGEHTSFEDEMQAWSRVLTNIALLIIATVHCLVSVVSIYHLSKRVCSCFKKKPPFDHNQFDPTFTAPPPYVIHLDEKQEQEERTRNHLLCKELEVKLQGDFTKKKEEKGEFDSANSKEKLVTRWLGRHHSAADGGRATRGARAQRRVPRGTRRAPPLVLLQPHPAATTLGRAPRPCVLVPSRYGSLPPAPLRYPAHDTRVRRRQTARHGERRRREFPREHVRERDSQLARSLERIHRKRRADRDRPTDADLARTYTGLDRAYAEQFIAVIDESRHAAELNESLPSTATAESATSHHKDL